KIWLRDGEEALVEGANTIDEEMSSDGFNHLYRDQGLLVAGPGATDLALEMNQLFDLYGFSVTHPTADLVQILKDQVAEQTKQGLRSIPDLATRLKNPQGLCRLVTQGKSDDGEYEYDRISRTLHPYLQSMQKSFYGISVEKVFAYDQADPDRWDQVLFQDL